MSAYRTSALRKQEFQNSLPGMCQVEEAVSQLSVADIDTRGAIFTKREVVEFILDLVGYDNTKDLAKFRLLEPSFGVGDFLVPAIERLISSYRAFASKGEDIADRLKACLRAVELNATSFERTRSEVSSLLRSHGVSISASNKLLDAWLIRGDYLLAEFPASFSHVVGNPPYVRQERIPDALMQEYRQRYSTIYDRADLYVPFIERSLELLSPKGMVGFICSDRWMKNKYGGPLRKLVAERFQLKYFVDMVDTPAFQSEVSAYPAIMVLANEQSDITRIAHKPKIDSHSLRALANSLAEKRSGQSKILEVKRVASGQEPWMLEEFDRLAVIRRIEAEFPKLEAVDCKVGIGVATGADKVFIGQFDELEVEPSRKMPLAMTRDINGGTVKWRGLGVINPFEDDGSLASLKRYPKFAKYLEQHGDAIRKRHVSAKNPSSWYRTIDRIYPELAAKSKLLIPDIKGSAHIVYEEGELYPHHNLYWVTSETWDLRALQAVLLSDISKHFVSLYSTKMRGGYLRFQAQYLRRICVPNWKDVDPSLRKRLIHAARQRDLDACNAASFDLYRLTKSERVALRN